MTCPTRAALQAATAAMVSAVRFWSPGVTTSTISAPTNAGPRVSGLPMSAVTNSTPIKNITNYHKNLACAATVISPGNFNVADLVEDWSRTPALIINSFW